MSKKIIFITILAVLLIGFIFVATRPSSNQSQQSQASVTPDSLYIYNQSAPPASQNPKYLTFQLGSGPDDNGFLGNPVSKDEFAASVQGIIDAIGTTGTAQNKFGFVIGPLAFEHTDEQVRQMIRDGFAIAKEKNVSVGFHIDDSMFWRRRQDLYVKKKH